MPQQIAPRKTAQSAGWKRYAAAVLTVCLLACSACSMKPLDAHISATSATTSETTPPALPTAALEPSEWTEPAVDLSGFVWTIRVPWADKLLPKADGTETDRQLLAVYDKLRTRYHAVIDIGYAPSLSDCIAAAAAGTYAADVLGIRMNEIPALSAAKALYAVDDPALLNAGLNCNDKALFWTEASAMTRYDGKQWAVQIASAYTIPAFGQMLLCNTTLLERLGAGNLYNLLETGKWTLSEYIRLSNAAASILPDTFGTAFVSPLSAYLSLGGRYVARPENTWRCELREDVSRNACTELYTLASAPAAYAGTGADAQNLFANGKLLFLWTDSNTVLANASLTDSEAVMLMPVPVGSSARRTPITGYEGYAFPANNASLLSNVTLFNALAKLLGGDWISAFIRQTKLNADAARIIEQYLLPALTVTADEFDIRFRAFFNDSIYAPLLEGDRSPEEILADAAYAFPLLTKAPDVSPLNRR